MPDFTLDRPVTAPPPRSGPRISMALDEAGGSTANQQCHGIAQPVVLNWGGVLPNPLIQPIFWGAEYWIEGGSIGSDTADQCVNLVLDLCLHGFFSRTRQYGVLNVLAAAPNFVLPPPPPQGLTMAQLRAIFAGWLGSYPPISKPSDLRAQWAENAFPGEMASVSPNPCYVIFLSQGTTIADEVGAGGYHDQVSFDGENVPFAVIFTNKTVGQSGVAFASTIAPLVGHELVEMATDPFGDGAISINGCEIGDLCEVLPTVAYLAKWNLERYWSIEDKICWSPPTAALTPPATGPGNPSWPASLGYGGSSGSTTIGGDWNAKVSRFPLMAQYNGDKGVPGPTGG